MVVCTLERKRGFQIGDGLNPMPNVPINDLSDCYLRPVEATCQGDSQATWGEEGITSSSMVSILEAMLQKLLRWRLIKKL